MLDRENKDLKYFENYIKKYNIQKITKLKKQLSLIKFLINLIHSWKKHKRIFNLIIP